MRQNNFEKIYQAAIHQNTDLLPTGGYCIDEYAEGQCDYSAISRCAQENNRDAVEWLLNHGAQINYAAYGAAFGGHQAYAEELLKRGADINWVSKGAAQGGYQAYAEELLGRGADIDDVGYAAALGGYLAYAKSLLWRGANAHRMANGAAEGGHLAFANELLWRGADINHVAQGAVLGGYHAYVEELLERRANINGVASGASLGGHQAYAEALLGRGANINFVAHGAASGGHQAYAEALLVRGANINHVAQGAARGGHQAYAEELHERGADIDQVAAGATSGQYQAYVAALLERGADIDWVARCANHHGDFKKPLTQLAYLPYFKPDQLDQAITQYCGSTKPRSEVLKRVRLISRYMHVGGYTHAEALAITEARTDRGLYYLLLLSIMHRTHRGDLKIFPSDVMLLISSFLAPSSLSLTDLSVWSLQALKGLLVGSLVQYQQPYWWSSIKYEKRAGSFKNAVARASNLKELISLIDKQFSLLSGNNPYPQDQQHEKYQTSTVSNTSDRFFKIVSRWRGRFNGPIEQQKSEVALEYKSVAGEEGHSEATQEDPSTIVGACVVS